MLFNKPKATHLQTGENAELRALKFLQCQGLQLLTTNYRCKAGELDLVMQEADFLVIVEVRYRKSEQFGGALASITRQKQLRIVSATQHYVIMHKLGHAAIRFDVVAISADNSINWIKNAFQT